jgi:hypothetical protein
MPPLSIPEGHSRMSNSATSNSYTQLPKIFMLVLVVATGIRLIVLYCTWQMRERRDSFQPIPEKKDATSCESDREEKKSSTSCQAPAETSTHNDHLRSQVESEHAFTPLYPWISPPQQLPGPYDSQYYPLPTIRRHSYDPSQEKSPGLQDHSRSYSRRVSTNSVLYGKVTASSNGTTGWRRNQWVVS